MYAHYLFAGLALFHLQYKIELALNGMVNGPPSCRMNIAEKLQLLRGYAARYHSIQFEDSSDEYAFGRHILRNVMPMAGWDVLLGLGGSIAYIIIKRLQKQISECAPPLLSGPRKLMRSWVVPYEALSDRGDLDVESVSVDLSQDLLLVAIQGEDTR